MSPGLNTSHCARLQGQSSIKAENPSRFKKFALLQKLGVKTGLNHFGYLTCTLPVSSDYISTIVLRVRHYNLLSPVVQVRVVPVRKVSE